MDSKLVFGVFFVRSQLNQINLDDKKKLGEIENDIKKRFRKSFVVKYFGCLSSKTEFQKLPSDEVKKCDFLLLAVLTGGSEVMMKLFEKFSKPIILKSTFLNNSLAASLEGRKYLKERAIPTFLFHETQDSFMDPMRFPLLEEKRKNLSGKWLTIGGKSDWLISSSISIERLKEFGIELIEVPSKEFIDREKNTKPDHEEVVSKANEFIENSSELIGVTKSDVLHTMKGFLVLKELQEKHNVKAMTIRCIDLIDDIESSVCLPVSAMNDLGVVTSCEGDLRSLFGMNIGYLVTRKPSFMGNISDYDIQKKELTISHCTIPKLLCNSFKLQTHFETNKGVAIHGFLKEKSFVTLFSLDNTLKNAILTEAELIQNVEKEPFCRTQLLLHVENLKFVEKTFGNHQIVCFSPAKDVEEFLSYLGITTFVL